MKLNLILVSLFLSLGGLCPVSVKAQTSRALSENSQTNTFSVSQNDIWGTETNDFQMSISLAKEQTQITNGQSGILLIRYRNISSNEVFRVSEMEHNPDFSFTITSPSGKDVSPDMRKLLYGDANQIVDILPNQSAEDTFDLNTFFKFNESGTYKIIAKKEDIWCINQKKEIQAVSNPLSVTVVPNQ